jgi:hypothetical protein
MYGTEEKTEMITSRSEKSAWRQLPLPEEEVVSAETGSESDVRLLSEDSAG